MVTFITEIITNPLFSVATLLLGFLIGHFLAIGRDRRKEFNAASDEFRKIFNQILVDIQSDRYGFGVPMSTEIIKTHRIAYLNFRPHLHRVYRCQYDEAWEQYCHNYENMGHMGVRTRITRADIEKDIKSILEFTEYRILRNMLFFCRKLWRWLRLKVLGPDKKTKELVEKFLKDYQDKHLLP